MRLLISSALFFLTPGAALAAPGLPEAFHGSVSGGVGTSINAIIGNSIVASTTVESGGVYGYAPHVFFIPDPSGNRTGASISFSIGGKPVTQTSILTNGTINTLNLSLPGVTTTTTIVTATANTTTNAPSSAATSPGNRLSTSTPPFQRQYDINHDRVVDGLDFVLLLTHWGVEGRGTAADINGDGVVNLFDFNLLIAHWTL